MRIATRPLKATAEPWDPADPEAFIALAKGQFVGLGEDGRAIVRSRTGCVMHAHPGWLAVRLDGDGAVFFMSPEHYGDDTGREWGPA